ncbi:unnamed protein product [Urochloa humidicola]
MRDGDRESHQEQDGDLVGLTSPATSDLGAPFLLPRSPTPCNHMEQGDGEELVELEPGTTQQEAAAVRSEASTAWMRAETELRDRRVLPISCDKTGPPTI